MSRWPFRCLCLFLLLVSCGPKLAESPNKKLVIAFGSCNKHNLKNVFWDDVLQLNPDLFIWGGDNVYADTEDVETIRALYDAQREIPAYARLREQVAVTGTWDDHDYGMNDGGTEYPSKKESQQAFLDFMDVPTDSPRRKQEGVYTAKTLVKDDKSINIIILDTRYFRSPLTPSKRPNARYMPTNDPQATILGEAQWKWLKEELDTSEADFNLIVTSIQFLSNEHGFEKWANFPHEADKMMELIMRSGAKGVVFLSGDRHISEFSRVSVEGLSYPLIDFTSSGLTHSYTSFSGEPNQYRIGEVVSRTSFGLIELNLDTNEVVFKIMGENGKVYQRLKQKY